MNTSGPGVRRPAAVHACVAMGPGQQAAAVVLPARPLPRHSTAAKLAPPACRSCRRPAKCLVLLGPASPASQLLTPHPCPPPCAACSWNDFLRGTSALFGGRELCDCYREVGTWRLAARSFHAAALMGRRASLGCTGVCAAPCTACPSNKLSAACTALTWLPSSWHPFTSGQDYDPSDLTYRPPEDEKHENRFYTLPTPAGNVSGGGATGGGRRQRHGRRAPRHAPPPPAGYEPCLVCTLPCGRDVLR